MEKKLSMKMVSSCCIKKIENFFFFVVVFLKTTSSSLCRGAASCLLHYFHSLVDYLIRVLVWLFSRPLDSFWIQLGYYIFFSVVGYFALKANPNPNPNYDDQLDVDLFFTSVSTVTVSSMSTMEMEAFSGFQLLILTFLMLLGGQVFTSLFRLVHSLILVKSPTNQIPLDAAGGGGNRAVLDSSDSSLDPQLNNDGDVLVNLNQIELGFMINTTNPPPPIQKKKTMMMAMMMMMIKNNAAKDDLEKVEISSSVPPSSDLIIKYDHNTNNSNSSLDDAGLIKCLGCVVLGYLLLVQLAGYALISLYINLVPSAKQVVEKKGLRIQTFSIFTAVSSFANCGFIPTNENMMVFKQNPGLLLILIPQILLGSTLYPPCLFLLIWSLGRITKRSEFGHILKKKKKKKKKNYYNYSHLMSMRRSCYLAATVVGFVLLQLIFFVSMEWNNNYSGVMEGLSSYQKLVASLFQVSNSRHTGESVFDLSIISPAVMALFVVMMYLPPYTSFLPSDELEDGDTVDDIEKNITCKVRKKEKKKKILLYVEYVRFSQLLYLGIFVILICITERRNLKEDPLNFNVWNILVEVISAYGNVGFSMGYSCGRRQVDVKKVAAAAAEMRELCRDAYYGFAGRWSVNGKLILILVMLFGRLKKFHVGSAGATAWKLT